jgi:hypothetical protein
MARMIGVLVIAMIARRWCFRLMPGPAPRIRPILTLKPVGGLRLRSRQLEASAPAKEVDEKDDHGNDQQEMNQGARDVKHAPPENPRDDENCSEPDHRCLVYGSSNGSNVAQDTGFAGGTQ